MKTFSKIALLLLLSFTLVSCSNKEDSKIYSHASDGLVYFKDSNKPFTGTVLDSSVMILLYDVVDGKKNGSFLVFFPDGKLAQSGYLIDNKNEGEWKYYYSNGNLESKGLYINDIPQGEWEFYYPSGVLKNKGKFKDGLKDKIWYDYNTEGELSNIYFFNNGTLSGSFYKFS